MKINALIILFFHFRRKAFQASLLSQQWKVLSQEVRFTRRPLDTRSIVRKHTKCHHYLPPEKKMKLMLLSESRWRETCNIRHIRNVEHKKQTNYPVGFDACQPLYPQILSVFSSKSNVLKGLDSLTHNAPTDRNCL